MIDRLRACLVALREIPEAELQAPPADALRRDCADALRLQLDCMQADLGDAERDVLRLLHDLLDDPRATGRDLADALQAASRVVRA